MNPITDLIKQGGPVMFAIIGLSVFLYSRCFGLLVYVFKVQRRLGGTLPAHSLDSSLVHNWKADLQEAFQRQKFPIGAMIAAAPLLGLLGTVSGMISTFESLSQQAGQKSMDGLAKGISEVLICTESGLAVAIPAIMLLYYAHRQTQKGLQRLGHLEESLLNKA